MLRYMERSTIYYLKQKGWTNVKTRRIYRSPPGHGCAGAARRRREAAENPQPEERGGDV
jgi:hypothetical protein